MRDGLARTMAALSPLSLSPQDAGTVELALAEALNNVVEHALATSNGETMIEVQGQYCDSGLHLTIIDQGREMPHGIAPAAQKPDLDVPHADMPEGGFGWFMIHSLASQVHYARIGDTNHLTLLLPVGLSSN